jgi:hypothetical protein
MGLKWILEKGDGGLNWIYLDQNREECWALVSMVMNIEVQ